MLFLSELLLAGCLDAASGAGVRECPVPLCTWDVLACTQHHIPEDASGVCHPKARHRSNVVQKQETDHKGHSGVRVQLRCELVR